LKLKEGKSMMDLKDLFPEWYAVIDPGFTSSRIAHRLSSISKIAPGILPRRFTSLVALFYGSCGDDGFVKEVRAALREVDETYVSHDTAELAVIAAGVIYQILSKSSSAANAIALLVLCGEFGGLRGVERIDAVVVRARHYLHGEGSRIRDEQLRVPNMMELLKLPIKKYQAANKQRAEGEEPDNSVVALDIHNDLFAVLKTYASGLSEAINALEKRRLEESSVLYWLLGGRILFTEEQFEGIDKARLALFAAHDLASQTQHLPGPASSRSILRTVIGYGKGKVQNSSIDGSLGKLLNGDGEHLLKRAHSHSPVFMPISFALEKKRENGWGGGWENAFNAQTKMLSNSTRQLDEIAEQFYRELLLARLIREA
jgi:GTPase-associated system helical domain